MYSWSSRCCTGIEGDSRFQRWCSWTRRDGRNLLMGERAFRYYERVLLFSNVAQYLMKLGSDSWLWCFRPVFSSPYAFKATNELIVRRILRTVVLKAERGSLPTALQRSIHVATGFHRSPNSHPEKSSIPRRLVVSLTILSAFTKEIRE